MWTDELTTSLIGLLELNPCLYAVCDADYHNRIKSLRVLMCVSCRCIKGRIICSSKLNEYSSMRMKFLYAVESCSRNFSGKPQYAPLVRRFCIQDFVHTKRLRFARFCTVIVCNIANVVARTTSSSDSSAIFVQD